MKKFIAIFKKVTGFQPVKNIILLILIFYKVFVSPLFELIMGKSCKYDLTCSEYAVKVIKRYGVLMGGKMAAKRFLSCNSWIDNTNILTNS